MRRCEKIGVGPGQSLLINGISGQLGLCAALLALAMGATKILGTGRNAALLDRVKSAGAGAASMCSRFAHPTLPRKRGREGTAGRRPDPLVAWAKAATDGHGVDGMIDCLPPGAPASAMMRALYCLRRGGRAVNVGAVMETLPLNAFWLMTNRIGLQGSVWFTTGEGEDMAAMAGAGTLDLSVLEHRVSPLVQGQRGARRHGRSRRRLHQFRHRSDAGRVDAPIRISDGVNAAEKLLIPCAKR